MNTIISLILVVLGIVVAFWLLGLLAAAIALPAIIWTLIKVIIVVAALAYVARLFGVGV
jgi:hypothetical protein